MRHPNLLAKENSVLIIIDVQEKFRKHIYAFDALILAIRKLIEACKILDIPIAVTEQYPQGLGSTVAEISTNLDQYERFTKQAFSCCQQGNFLDYLKHLKRKQVIVCGIESHVCVSQSVHDLLALGYFPHLIVEAIGSRTIENKEIGLKKMIASGAILSSLEMALFELLNDSAEENFRAIQQLIK